MMQNVPLNNYRDLSACHAVSKAQTEDKEMRNMLESSKGKVWSFIRAGGMRSFPRDIKEFCSGKETPPTAEMCVCVCVYLEGSG